MARTTFSYLGVLILVASCGSTSGTDGSGSGTGGAGGASGGGTGGTGGASTGGTGGASTAGSAGASTGGQSGAGGQGGSGGLGPTPMGGVSLFVTSTASTPSSSFCKQYPNWVNVPFSAAHGQSFGPTKTGIRAVDGEREMEVQCAVTMAGSAFAVTGHLNSPALGLDNNRLPPSDVTVEVTVANDQANAVGKISLTDDLRTGRYESTDCTFSVHPQAQGELLGVAAGRVAATVSCANLRSIGDASEVCQITQGYVILENCTQ